MILTKDEIRSILQMLEQVPFKGVKSAESLISLRTKFVDELKVLEEDGRKTQTTQEVTN